MIADNASPSEDLRFEVMDENKLRDRCMGVSRRLRLGRWLKILDEEGEEEIQQLESDFKNGDIDTKSGKKIHSLSGDPLGFEEREKLLAEWGNPKLDITEVWKKLYHPEDHSKLQGGELKVDLGYFPIEENDKMVDASGHEITAGILRVYVHQAKDLDPSKSISGKYNPFFTVELNGEWAYKSAPKKRTNNPVWEVSLFF